MTTPNVEPNDQQTTETPPVGHPAWKQILEPIPEEYHPLITPTLEEWDKGVNSKLEEVRNRYSGYQPFLDQGIDPSQVQQALAFAQQLEQDPQRVVKLMADHFKVELGQTASSVETDDGDDDDDFDDDDDLTDPRIKQLQREIETIKSSQTQREQELEQERFDRQLDQHLIELHEQHGAFDEFVVLSHMAQGVPSEQAVKLFKEHYPNYVEPVDSQAAQGEGTTVAQVVTPQATVPVVMGNAGTAGVGSPTGEPVNPGKWNKNQTDDAALKFIQDSLSKG